MGSPEVIVVSDELSLPLREVEVSFTTSGGPGGQHANRSATRVTVRFDVLRSPSLSDRQRGRLIDRLASRLSAGVLQLHVQETRSQHRNRELALERLRELLAEALEEEATRHPTRPTKSSHEKRLDSKRHRGQLKRDRGAKYRADE